MWGTIALGFHTAGFCRVGSALDQRLLRNKGNLGWTEFSLDLHHGISEICLAAFRGLKTTRAVLAKETD